MPSSKKIESQFQKYDTTWSVSKLNLKMRCDLKYFFKYIAKYDSDGRYWLTRGVIFHDVIASYLEDTFQTEQDLFTKVSQQWAQASADGLETHGFSWSADQVKQTILLAIRNTLNYFGNKLYSNVLYTNKDGILTDTVEMPFRIPFESIDHSKVYAPVDLIGFIDFIYESENTIYIVDHKLHSAAYTDFKTQTDIQLPLYYYVVEYLIHHKGIQIDPKTKIKLGFLSHHIKKTKSDLIINSKFVPVTYTKKWIEKTKTLVADVINKEEFNKTLATPTYTPTYIESECKYLCDYKDLCLDWRLDKDLSKYPIKTQTNDDLEGWTDAKEF